MNSVKGKASHRLLAAFLSLVMVFSMIPFSAVATAATVEHPDAVTICVKDEKNRPVEGAAVNVTIASIKNGSTQKKLVTDVTGCVEVMAAKAFVDGDLTVSAEISKADYKTDRTTIHKAQITSGTQNFEVVLKKAEITPPPIELPEIKNVTIEGKTSSYTGQEQDLVFVTKVKGDTVTYVVDDGEPTTVKPAGKDVCSHKITVTVSRKGYQDLVRTVVGKIEPAEITGISLRAKAVTYNEKEQDIVEVQGAFERKDIVTWTVNGEETVSHQMPMKKAVGTYVVSMKVDRGANYKELVVGPVTAKITAATLIPEGITVKGLAGVYTAENGVPKAQEALLVENPKGYTLKYQLDDGDLKVDESAWLDDIPTVTNAGSYIVWVKAVKEGYNDADVSVTPAESAEYPYNVYIAKAPQTLAFKNPAYTDGGSSAVTVDTIAPFDQKYDFEVTYDAVPGGGSVSYSIELSEEDKGIATIDQTGKLTVTHPGAVTVVATLTGNDNYEPREIRHTLEVSAGPSAHGTYIHFAKETVDAYTIGQNGGVAANNPAIKTVPRDRGKVTYSVQNGEDLGLSVDERGKVFVSDYAKVINAAKAAGGKLVVTVRADKAAVKGWHNRIKYPADFTTYALTIQFFPTPDAKVTVSKPDGKDGWYVHPMTVTAPEGYAVAKVEGNTGNNFAPTVVFDDQGTLDRYVCLQDPATGGITAPITVQAKIDTEDPDELQIEFSDATLIQKIGEKLGFYKPNVTITLTAKDAASGVDHFNWTYTKEAGASNINAESIFDRQIPVEVIDGVATAKLQMPRDNAEQYRGKISFTATDKAGNTSVSKSEDSTFVVDDIAPTMHIKYAGKDPYEGAVHSVGDVHYFNGAVDVELTITEANFYQEDVKVSVSKDGAEAVEKTPHWTDTDVDTHVGTFTLDGDGEYVVYVTYKDKADNEMRAYQSETLAIDTEKPVVNLEYVHKGKVQKTIFTVTEHNFRPSDVVVSGTMKDIKGQDLAFTPEQLTTLLQNAEWTKKGDTYTYVYDQYVDGIYNLTLNYKDTADWSADPFVAEEFMVDHTAPAGIKIEYAKSPGDAFLEAITLGFYNPSVQVRFTAYDNSTGVASFTWGYTKEAGASTINHPQSRPEETVKALQDANDKSKFTAEVTLTATELEQYRGYLTVSAVDEFKNESGKTEDKENIVVVDTVPPTMKAEYTKADRVVEGTNTSYYNNDIDVAFTVTEANFYPEDVKVSVTKDGVPYDFGSVSWGSRNEKDESVGTFTLKAPMDHSGDGAYVITVDYQDRSHNVMDTYVSGTYVIDTTRPLIDVAYQNENVARVLKDHDNHDRKYFADTQKAVITIDERNFNAEDVALQIVAEDVGGAKLDADALHMKSEWTVGAADHIHVLTITYPGDANYTFDIAYTDLADNAAAEYAPDYFTVDKTAPVNLTIDYSDSVLDTVIDATDFGFHNGKVTVTLSAEDPTSGVHSFLYSYVNASGVSSVNAELLNQAIEAGDITYSADGRRASATFEIPKAVLDREHQFNGTVEFTAYDRGNTKAGLHKEAKRVVVDTIAPNAEISYNEAVNMVGDIAYYDGAINAAVTVNEANFYAEDVRVLVSKDKGPATVVTPVWSNSGNDVHMGTFTLSGDGDYVITVNYMDKSGNSMVPYTSKQMTIDTEIKEPTYSINGVAKTEFGGAYKDGVVVAFNFEDQNFDTKTITLTRTRFNAVEDVTSKFVRVAENGKGGSGSFEIPAEVENDGIYVMHISMTDRAKHTTESQIKFTVNRYGSVYEYNDTLTALIRDGGQHITSVQDDLVITEYNASKLLRDSLNILITRDGKPIDVDFVSNPANIDEQVGIGESGWYQYVYRIKASNFAEDGVYKISLTSKYAVDDSGENASTSVPENSMDKDGKQILDTMTFTVDSKAPEIRNIVNLDKPIVNAQTLDVKYTIVDVGGLQSIEVIVNGKTVDTITDFGDNQFSYSGQFTMNEMFDAQTVRLKATDLAGNVTDTASDEFTTGDLYIFHDKVTVSTNAFVRWYANKPLFWGTIGGAVVLVGAIWFILIAKRKKKDEESE